MFLHVWLFWGHFFTCFCNVWSGFVTFGQCCVILVSPRKARIDLNRFVLRVVGDGMNTFWSVARRNLGVRSWKLHHENRREALFHAKWVRRLKSWILKGKCRVSCEVDWGRRIFEKYLGHVWVVILELGAETVSESRYFYARPAQISFKSWLC